MATVVSGLDQAKQVLLSKVDSYQGEFNFWKADYQAAQLYFNFGDLIRDGLELYQDLASLDERWRMRIYRDAAAYDTGFEQMLAEHFKQLGKILASIETDLLPLFEATYTNRNQLLEFRSACRELQGIATPDADFFVSEKLLELKDAAIAELKNGSTRDA